MRYLPKPNKKFSASSRSVVKLSGPRTAKQIERYFKGSANHRRIEIIMLLAKGKGITLEQIADQIDCNLKTTSEHTRRLVIAGLLNKEYAGRNVIHTLSPYGKRFATFIRTFSHS